MPKFRWNFKLYMSTNCNSQNDYRLYKTKNCNRSCNKINWSGKRGSNPWPLPWQGSALSTELLPRIYLIVTKVTSNYYNIKNFFCCQAIIDIFFKLMYNNYSCCLLKVKKRFDKILYYYILVRKIWI